MVFNVDMRVCIFQHSPSDPPGTTLDWLNQKSIKPDIYRVDLNQFPSSIKNYDWLIVLGGEPNVDEIEKYPWLGREKDLIKQAVSENKIILGLCLGGQLLAESLGAKVGRHPHWEVGWWNVDLLSTNKKLKIFQWHGYSFETPKGTRLLATNEANSSQAFVFKDRMWGFQFHPEATTAWVQDCAAGKIPSGTYCQSKEDILNGLTNLPDMTKWFHSLLDHIFKINT